LTANRKTQARSAELAGRGAVSLYERFEDGMLAFLRDPNARVVDREKQSRHTAHRHFNSNRNYDSAALGELDCVSDEVDQDLSDSSGISDEHSGNVWGDMHVRVKFFALACVFNPRTVSVTHVCRSNSVGSS
jgi:hypothetical protein